MTHTYLRHCLPIGSLTTVKQEPSWAHAHHMTHSIPTESASQHFPQHFPGIHSSRYSDQQMISHCPITQRANKRRPGPYDRIKDQSGKINLELVGILRDPLNKGPPVNGFIQIHDAEERKRVQDKRLKNRVAAEKSRTRKKEQTRRLEDDANRLRLDNEHVTNELQQLKQLARKLRVVQSEHEKLCEFAQQSAHAAPQHHHVI